MSPDDGRAPPTVRMLPPSCQACALPIPLGSPVIRVSYGILGTTAHPHLRVQEDRTVGREAADYFHRTCAGSVAIRQPPAAPDGGSA